MSTEERKVVVPGEVLAEGMDYIPGYGTYRTKEKVRASLLGLLSKEGKVLKIIPVSGVYLPKKNDVIIGKVIDINLMGWRVELNSPYSAMLGVKEASFDFIEKGADLTRYFQIGDYMVAKIVQVTSQMLIDLTVKAPGLKKLRGGQVITVNPHKVPRVIGKKGSMVSMIKNATGCKINVGQNGWVWIEGDPAMEVIAVRAIKKIEQESHHNGLTGEMKRFLEEKTGKPVPATTPEKKGDTHDHKN